LIKKPKKEKVLNYTPVCFGKILAFNTSLKKTTTAYWTSRMVARTPVKTSKVLYLFDCYHWQDQPFWTRYFVWGNDWYI